ncbi:MAG: quinolinate synthase NadA [Rikenellaceae bacterium]|nr:quinolinate synthase NadA [Rikenellaceae bacterium]MCL2693425.1 quinolinate synthase NadA [Rikenellaceae bacterium]
MDYAKEIARLKKEKRAVILAHYYTRGEVQDVADFVGDSLALSEAAAHTDADIIVFAGVHFMAETAKVLSPEKKVLLPDIEAGCSLAESCPADAFREFRKQYPDHLVVSYVNTTVGIKAQTDICCTSTNALQVIESIPAERGIIFAPDRNLGAYLQSLTGRENMVLWDGACHVHEEFSLEKILELKRLHPQAKIVAHPECKAYILAVADFVGSTSALLNFCARDEAQEFIVVTEPGILHRMQCDNPSKTFIPAPPIDSTCGCNDCVYMKMNTLEKIYAVLRDESNEITIPEKEREEALGPIVAMLEIGKK